MRPSDDAITSCGSGPDGTFPSTFSVEGSTTDSVRSPLERTRSVPAGADDDWAAASAAATADTIASTNDDFMAPPDLSRFYHEWLLALGFWLLGDCESVN